MKYAFSNEMRLRYPGEERERRGVGGDAFAGGEVGWGYEIQ